MKIFVKHNWTTVKDSPKDNEDLFVSNEKVFTLECESTDTIAHLKAKVHAIEGTIPLRRQKLMFDGKELGDNFSENMTLTDVGVREGSMLQLDCQFYIELCSAGELERPPRTSEKDYLYYADAFKSGWREEHAKQLLDLLLQLCQDGTISEGNVTEEAWLRIQNGLKNSTNCSFQIDFLKERLRDYKQLYSLLAETNSPIFHWDHEKKTIRIKPSFRDDWRKVQPELLLLCGPYIPYFDTLEEVCLQLNTKQSSEQQASDTSTSINNEKLIDQDIPRHFSQKKEIPRLSNSRSKFGKFRQSSKQLLKLSCCAAALPGVCGKRSFTLKGRSQMLIAGALEIAHSNNDLYWTWVHQSDSRFTEVAELLVVWWLDIHARINFDKLSTETNYAAHLIFKTTPSSYGLDTCQEASVSVGSLQCKKVVCAKPSAASSRNKSIGLPIKRSDGWMELELGKFYCDNGTGDQEVVVGFKETNDNNRKSGLIVAGIELRPI